MSAFIACRAVAVGLLCCDNRLVATAQMRIGVDVLLVTHADFADDVKVRPVGLENEKITHGNRWLENDVGDVEIVRNHYQIRRRAMVLNFS